MEIRDALADGTIVAGEYRILKALRQDGFCITYEAEDVQLGARVLLKEYFPAELSARVRVTTVRPRSTRDVSALSWGRQRFCEEMRTLAKLRHPGLAVIRGVVEDNNTAYAVIEAQDAPTLLSWLIRLRRPPSEAEILTLADEICGALEVLHGVGALCRDLSPETIYVRGEDHRVLMDFGGAKFAVAARARKMHTVVRPGFSAPEQHLFDEGQQGPWTDVFALGGVLYRMATGRTPDDVIHRHTAEAMPSARDAGNKTLRPDLLKAIDLALSLDARHRPQSITAFRALLGVPSAASLPTATAGARDDGGGRRRPSLLDRIEAAPIPPLDGGGAASAGQQAGTVRASDAGTSAQAPAITAPALPTLSLEEESLGLADALPVEPPPESAGEDARARAEAAGGASAAAPQAPSVAENGADRGARDRNSGAAAAEEIFATSSRQFLLPILGIALALLTLIGLGLVLLDTTLAPKGPPSLARTLPAEVLGARGEAQRQSEAADAKRRAEETERQRLAAMEAERQRQAEAAEANRRAEEAEGRRNAAIAAERKRQAEAADAKRRAEEAEGQRLAAIEAERMRQAEAAEANRRAEEAERRRNAAIAAERKRQAEAADAKRRAEETERQRIAAMEAERKRQAEAADAKRRAEEAERQRLAAMEAERKRQAEAADAKRRAEEAERQRLAAMEAERKRQAEAADAKRRAEESERQRLAAIEAEKKRQADADAERKRIADAQAAIAAQLEAHRASLIATVESAGDRESLLVYRSRYPELVARIDRRLAVLGFVKTAIGGETRWTRPGSGDVFRDCPTCPQMLLVPAGSFMFGSPAEEPNRLEDEDDTPGPGGRPVRVGIARPFALSKFEVTRGQFAAFVTETGHDTSGGCYVRVDQFELVKDYSWQQPGFDQDDEHPVACVSWDDARAYVAWLSKKTGATYRLPSEAEWEFAARAAPHTQARAQPFDAAPQRVCRLGNSADLSTQAVFPAWTVSPCDDRAAFTARVGSFAANAIGLADMLGNQWEWVADCYHDSYRGQPDGVLSGGVAWTTDCKGDFRVLRGGSWSDTAAFLRPAARTAIPPDKRIQIGGFRVARALED